MRYKQTAATRIFHRYNADFSGLSNEAIGAVFRAVKDYIFTKEFTTGDGFNVHDGGRGGARWRRKRAAATTEKMRVLYDKLCEDLAAAGVWAENSRN